MRTMNQHQEKTDKQNVNLMIQELNLRRATAADPMVRCCEI